MELLLYNLDSPKDAGPVCILKEGVYNVGRGPLLKCNDKRISRNHARITVKDEVSITSTHQNPCFYQAANSKTITILAINTPTTVTSGDKFGFLTNLYWYRTEINCNIKSNNNDEQNNILSIIENTSVINVQNEDDNISNKRHNNDELDGNSTKHIKLDADSTDMKFESSNAEDGNNSEALLNEEKGSNHSLDLLQNDEYKELVTNFDADTSEVKKDYTDHVDEKNCTSSINEHEDSNTSLDLLQFKECTSPTNIEALTNLEKCDNNIDEISNKQEKINSDVPKVKCESSALNVKTEISVGDNDDSNCSLVLLSNIKAESNIESMNENLEDKVSEEKLLQNLLTNLKGSIKDRVDVGTNTVNVDTIASNSVNDISSCSNVTNTNDANTAVSSTTNSTTFRERCLYGDKCYRKNSSHKQQFSHPGDPDYDTDPEDARPLCIYGSGCYRKNMLHRAHYRHPKSTGIRNRRRNTGARGENESPIDDYDIDDPFINDSDDDEEFNEESWSESDSDYVVSQDVEEDTKGLLKEAKRFVKK